MPSLEEQLDLRLRLMAPSPHMAIIGDPGVAINALRRAMDKIDMHYGVIDVPNMVVPDRAQIQREQIIATKDGSEVRPTFADQFLQANGVEPTVTTLVFQRFNHQPSQNTYFVKGDFLDRHLREDAGCFRFLKNIVFIIDTPEQPGTYPLDETIRGWFSPILKVTSDEPDNSGETAG